MELISNSSIAVLLDGTKLYILTAESRSMEKLYVVMTYKTDSIPSIGFGAKACQNTIRDPSSSKAYKGSRYTAAKFT